MKEKIRKEKTTATTDKKKNWKKNLVGNYMGRDIHDSNNVDAARSHTVRTTRNERAPKKKTIIELMLSDASY